MRARGTRPSGNTHKKSSAPAPGSWLAWPSVGGRRGFNACCASSHLVLTFLRTAAFRKQNLECEGGRWRMRILLFIYFFPRCMNFNAPPPHEAPESASEIKKEKKRKAASSLDLLSPVDPRLKLGGRCCRAKSALKCLPGCLVSPTTQSNHIRSLYLCLGRVRRCSCVHPPPFMSEGLGRRM